MHNVSRALTDQIRPPADFLNVTDANQNGFYLFGYDDFQVMDMPVAGILQRSIAGRHEDFILGVISVMIIAVLSEIIQTILMRTRQSQVSLTGLHTAFALDELAHFRNVWAFITCRFRTSPRTRRVASNSLIIALLGLSLLAAEVFAVFLTQPRRVFTTQYQYNLRGLQPAGTSIEMARHIDRVSTKKRCVTPSMTKSNQSREYSISACIKRDSIRKMDKLDDVAKYVEVGSWFHEAGSDHVVTFGNETQFGQHSIQTRASIMQGTIGVTKGLLFYNRDTDNMTHASYLQMYMIRSAIEWNCEQGFESRSCNTMKLELKIEGRDPSNETIVLWEQGDEDVTKEVRGIVTRFIINIRRPYLAIEDALSVFAASAVIEEVRGKGMYVSMENGQREHGIEKLVSEEGRVAGIFLLIFIFIGLMMILIVLRILLRPVSLAQIAREIVPEELECSDADFVGAGPMWQEPQRNVMRCRVSLPRRPHRAVVLPQPPPELLVEDEYVSSSTLRFNLD